MSSSMANNSVAGMKNITAFSPQTIPGLALWFDAADTSTIVKSGENVSTWRNKAVYGSASNTSTSGTVTSTTLNGIPALSFAASAGMTVPSSSVTYANTTRTAFIVAAIDASGASTDYFFMSNANVLQDFTFQIRGSNAGANTGIAFLSGYSALVYKVTYPPNGIYNATSLFCCTSLTTNGGIFINGTNIASGSPANQFSTGANGAQTIGLASSTAAFRLGEIILFDGAIPDTQRQQVEGYLANKWGLVTQLPVTHPYYSSSTAIIRQPRSRIFQPSDISGLALWLDGADRTSMTFSGSTISQWNDKSANGYNATVASAAPGGTSTYTATATFSTNPLGVYFPDKYTAYNTSYPANPQSETAFIVARTPSPSEYNNMVVGGPQGARSMCYGYNPLTSCAYLNNQVVWLCSTGAGTYTSDTTALVTGLISPNGGGSSPTIAINGGAMSAATPTTFSNVHTVIGADTSSQGNGNIFHYIGYIMEIIFYNSVLTTSQIKQVESYLAQKWNISSRLAAGHPGRFLPSYTSMFTPKTLAPVLWLDAADASTITLSSGSVTAWADKSGTGYSAIPFTGDNTGVTTITNGITSIYGTYPFRMYIPSFAWNNTFTQFVVAKGYYSIVTSLAANPLVDGTWYKYMSTGNWSLFLLQSLYGTDTRYIQGPGDPHPYEPALLPGAVNMWAVFCIGSNLGATLSHYTLNGSSGLSDVSYNNGSVSAGSDTGNFIINGFSTYSALTVNLGEIVHYNRSLTVNERQQVEGYLAWKWGTQGSLPSTHPYAKFQP